MKSILNILSGTRLGAALLLTASCGLLATGCGDNTKLPEEPPAGGNLVRHIENATMHSTILSRGVGYSVYLPENYGKDPDERYGVVYLLHGYGDSNSAWMRSIRVGAIADRLVAAGELGNYIYVMPDGYTSYYVNTHDGSFRYMDMFVNELVPHIDKAYRTKASASHRAVAGYSMGGFGAMVLPSLNPGVFTVACPLSMSVRTDEQYKSEPSGVWDNQWGAIFGGRGTAGDSRLTDYYRKHSPLHFFKDRPVSDFSDVRYFIDCGDDEEQLSVANDELHILMRQAGVPHQYRVRNGAHTTDYWVRGMDEVLRFIDASFRNASYDGTDGFTPPSSYSAVLDFDGAPEGLDGVNTKVFLPADYVQGNDGYPVIYYATEREMLEDNALSGILSTLDSLQRAKPFILVAFDGVAAAGNGQVERVADWVDARWNTDRTVNGRLALLYGACAATIADAGDKFGSVFVSDGATGITPSTGDISYCYIDITDNGTHYADSNALYIHCRDNSIRHEYRVRAGKDDLPSLLSGINSMVYYIGQRLTLK